MGTTQINAGLAIDLNSAGQGTTAAAHRRVFGLLLQQNTPGVPAQGRLGSDHFVVTGRADMKYGVSAGGVVIVRSSTGGAYIVPSVQDIVVDTDNASGVNPRIDRIYVRQPDPALDGPTVDVRAVIGVAVGLPAASPIAPELPAGAMQLAWALVPAGVTRTSGLTFTDIAPVVGINVGVAAVPNGGTGATTPAGARKNIGISSGTGDPSNAVGADGDIYFKIL